MKIWPLNRRGLGHVTHFEILGPPLYFMERLNIETSYLVHLSNTTSSSQSMTNWPLKWAWSRSRDLDLKFGTPCITLEWIKIRALNFVQLHVAWSPLSADEKFTSTGAWLGSHDTFWNFGIRFISSEQLKIETSYLVLTLSVTRTSQCITNWSLKPGWSGHVT